MNIPSNSFVSISSSSSPRHLCCTDSPNMKTRGDTRIDDGDMFLEKGNIKHDTLVKAKSAIAWGYNSYESLSPRATSTCRPTIYYSEGKEEEDDDDEFTLQVLRQLSTTCQHQQHKRETQETQLTSKPVQSDALNETIGKVSCFDSFLRACDAIAKAIVEEVDTYYDNENEKCTRSNASVRRIDKIGRKVVRFDLSRNTILLF